MQRFIVTRPGSFLLAVIGGIFAFAGFGALAMRLGVPTEPLLYGQLIAYMFFALYVAIAVSDKVAGAVAVALAAAVPLLLPFARLEYAVRQMPLVAVALVLVGVSASTLIYLHAMRGSSQPRSATPVSIAPPREQHAH
jgi:hypothetical protein